MPVLTRSPSPPLSEISTTFTHAKVSHTAYTQHTSLNGYAESINSYESSRGSPSRRPTKRHRSSASGLNAKCDRMMMSLTGQSYERGSSRPRSTGGSSAAVGVFSPLRQAKQFHTVQVQGQARLGSNFGVLKGKEPMTPMPAIPRVLNNYSDSSRVNFQNSRYNDMAPNRAVIPEWLTAVFSELDPSNPLRRLALPQSEVYYDDPNEGLPPTLSYQEDLGDTTLIDWDPPNMPGSYAYGSGQPIEGAFAALPQEEYFENGLHRPLVSPVMPVGYSPPTIPASHPPQPFSALQLPYQSPGPVNLSQHILQCPKPQKLSPSQQWSATPSQTPTPQEMYDYPLDTHDDYPATYALHDEHFSNYEDEFPLDDLDCTPPMQRDAQDTLLIDESATVFDDETYAYDSAWRYGTDNEAENVDPNPMSFCSPLPPAPPVHLAFKKLDPSDVYASRLREFATLMESEDRSFVAREPLSSDPTEVDGRTAETEPLDELRMEEVSPTEWIEENYAPSSDNNLPRPVSSMYSTIDDLPSASDSPPPSSQLSDDTIQSWSAVDFERLAGDALQDPALEALLDGDTSGVAK